MVSDDIDVLLQNICKNIEIIIENIGSILDLLKKYNSRIDNEMASLVMCKQKSILICDAVLLIFKDIVSLKHSFVDISSLDDYKHQHFNAEEEFNKLIKKIAIE